MRNQFRHKTLPVMVKTVALTMLGVSLMLTGGCKELERESGDGTLITEIALPTDTLLDLSCAEMGINGETCVLNDPDNPFRTAVILEFNVADPEAENKFDLLNQIPPDHIPTDDFPMGPNYAKARVYFWSTALARRASGENQWFTARALHELFDLNNDPVIQAQALKAYRSVLDNFFGSVVFFECCENVNPSGNPVPFSVPLNELAADDIYRTDATGFARLIPGNPLLALSVLSEWGFSYQPATGPMFNNGVVSVNGG